MGFFLVEVGLRFLPKSSNDVIRYDPILRRKYLANLDTYISSEDNNRAVHFKTNSLGFVGSEYKKEKSGFRIINLGDSFTAGWGVDFDKNFSTLLAPMLTEKTGVRVESLNFGIGGQGTMNSVATYKQYGKQFTPDLVLLWFYLGNDFRDNLLYKEKEVQVLWQRLANRSELLYLIITRIQRNTRLLSIVSILRGRTGVFGGAESGMKNVPGDLDIMQSNLSILENKRSEEVTKRYLEFLRTAVEGDGSKLMVVALPANFQVDKELEKTYLREYPSLNTARADFNAVRSENKLLEILDELGLAYLDLVPFMKERCKIDCNFYLVPGGHFSQGGHKFVASSTADFLIQQELIK